MFNFNWIVLKFSLQRTKTFLTIKYKTWWKKIYPFNGLPCLTFESSLLTPSCSTAWGDFSFAWAEWAIWRLSCHPTVSSYKRQVQTRMRWYRRKKTDNVKQISTQQEWAWRAGTSWWVSSRAPLNCILRKFFL